MCTALLPPGVNPTTVNKYININNNISISILGFKLLQRYGSVQFPTLCIIAL